MVPSPFLAAKIPPGHHERGPTQAPRARSRSFMWQTARTLLGPWSRHSHSRGLNPRPWRLYASKATHPAVADYDRLPVPLRGRGSEKRLWSQVGGFPQTSQRQTKGSTSLSSGHVRHKAVSTPVWIAAARSPLASWPATTQFCRVPFAA